MGFFSKSSKTKLIETANHNFIEAGRVIFDFLTMVGNNKKQLTIHDAWLLRSFQLSIIWRCLGSEADFKTNYAKDFDALFDQSMTPYIKDHQDIAAAMNFFAKQEDAVRCAGFILDSIALDLDDPLTFITQFWEEGHLVPALHKMPYSLKLLQKIFVSAGTVIKSAYGLDKYKHKLDKLFTDDEIQDLTSTIETVPNNSAEIFASMKKVYIRS
jgi:hypothetical protein